MIIVLLQQNRFEDYIPEQEGDDEEFLDGFFGTVSGTFIVTLTAATVV